MDLLNELVVVSVLELVVDAFDTDPVAVVSVG